MISAFSGPCWRRSTGTSNYIRTVRVRHLSDRYKGKPIVVQEIYPFQTVPPEESRPKEPASRTTDIALRRIGLIDLAKSKLYEAQTFYDEFSGMHEVKAAQNKVIEIQEQLQLVQERRRHVLLELTLVRKQLQEIHIELQKSTRGEHRYVELIKEEFDVLTREKGKTEIFQIIDQEERELFSHLTAAVKTSHEKERMQANNVKYWSIIASGVGALLGIVATSINYYFRNTQFETIRKAGEENHRMLLEVQRKLSGLEQTVGTVHRQLIAKRVAEKPVARVSESWGSYLRRHTSRFFRLFIPKA
ncbi:mitochondrial potassium channel-like [Anopheles bellator]|uniref:mitochondrial potassium channel-like n=1 Tax=Anopheles bellator TaxID=139047 RepID=UPI002647C887|nr:mitochondrial potassium channel-like [Anopheles bellator]